MMPKYIDADVLKEIFALECKDVCDDTDEFDTKWGASQELIEKVIDSAPAADVEGKRMPGVWLEQDETPNVSSNKIYRCSICDYADEQSPSAEVPYCWHCGSKMKKMFRGGGE
jgi:hypothetical protein